MLKFQTCCVVIHIYEQIVLTLNFAAAVCKNFMLRKEGNVIVECIKKQESIISADYHQISIYISTASSIC